MSRVAAIVVNYNAGVLLARCIEALCQQQQPFTRIIVVDNASTDGSLDTLGALHDRVDLLRNAHNAGFARACNQGAAWAAPVDYLAMINPDTVLPHDWLQRLLPTLQQQPNLAALGCTLCSVEDPNRCDGLGDAYHLSGKVWRRGHARLLAEARRDPNPVFAPCAAAALYRASAFKALGGFDEAFFCYLEDIDLAFRLRLYGWQVGHCDEVTALHHGGYSSEGGRSAFARYHGHRNLVWCYAKNMPTALLWRSLPQHILLNLITLAAALLSGRPGPIWRAKGAALLGLPRILRQRRTVQQQRRLSVKALRPLLSQGWLTPYLERQRRPTRPTEKAS